VPLTKPAGPAGPALRASDADRDRTADLLRDALGEGRLTAEEHAERVGAVYAARTVGELEAVVADLPRPPAAPRHEPAARPYGSSAPAGTEHLVAVFGGATRRGRWRVPWRTTAFALFGGVEIDLTEAIFERQEIVINVVAIFGGVEITISEM